MAEQVIECGAQCAVTVQLAPAPPSTENIEDITLAFYVLLSLVLGVWCLRQLINVFTSPDER
jgi:hypothetical protein